MFSSTLSRLALDESGSFILLNLTDCLSCHLIPLPCHSKETLILATLCRLSSTHLVHSLKCLFFPCFFSERIGFACCLGFFASPFPSWAKFYVLNQRSLVSMIDLISLGSKELGSSGPTLWLRMSWKDHTRSKSFSVIPYFLFWDCNIMVWSNRVPEASVSGCFSFTRGLWISWKSSSGISHQRCLFQHGYLWGCSESCDGFRQQGGLFRQCQGWPDVEKGDKTSALNYLQREQSSAKKPGQGESREVGWECLWHNTIPPHQGILLVEISLGKADTV